MGRGLESSSPCALSHTLLEATSRLFRANIDGFFAALSPERRHAFANMGWHRLDKNPTLNARVSCAQVRGKACSTAGSSSTRGLECLASVMLPTSYGAGAKPDGRERKVPLRHVWPVVAIGTILAASAVSGHGFMSGNRWAVGRTARYDSRTI